MIFKPEVFHNRQVVENEQGIPYIVRTKFNNGVKFRVEKKKNMSLSPGGVISFGAENTSFFYQKEPFVSGRDIYYIDTQKFSKRVCLYLISCLQTLAKKYSYSYGLFPDHLKKEKIKLPVNQDGNPDWEYMEEYIFRIESDLKKLQNTTLFKSD